jgi:hypothetical protein
MSGKSDQPCAVSVKKQTVCLSPGRAKQAK